MNKQQKEFDQLIKDFEQIWSKMSQADKQRYAKISASTDKVYVDPDEGYESTNQYEVAYQIMMDYFDQLADETKLELDERLKAIDL